jgi:hypothetical protein
MTNQEFGLRHSIVIRVSGFEFSHGHPPGLTAGKEAAKISRIE